MRLSSLYISPADSLCECTNIQCLIQSLHERELVQLKWVASRDHARLRGWPEKTNELPAVSCFRTYFIELEDAAPVAHLQDSEPKVKTAALSRYPNSPSRQLEPATYFPP